MKQKIMNYFETKESLPLLSTLPKPPTRNSMYSMGHCNNIGTNLSFVLLFCVSLPYLVLDLLQGTWNFKKKKNKIR